MRACNFKDLTGKTFGRLRIDQLAYIKNKQAYWDCTCLCGTKKTVGRASLLSGRTSSCGCLLLDILSKRRFLKPYEGLYKRLLRASQQTSTKRQVTVTYEEFLEFTKINQCHYCESKITWQPHNAVSSYNLDRKDNSGDYTKENCVVCCIRCNIGKNQYFSYDEWKRIGNFMCANKEHFKGEYE